MAGGWAGWIKSDRGVLTVDGAFKAPLLDTTIAEAMAALNTICYAISQGIVQEGDLIILATDNNSVMNILEGRVKRKFKKKTAIRRKWTMKEYRIYVNTMNKHIDKIADIFERKMIETGADFRWNHVKGHRGTADKRSAVNHGCDKRAKQAMRQARKDAKK